MLFADYSFHRSRVCVSSFDLITFETNKKDNDGLVGSIDSLSKRKIRARVRRGEES